MLNQCDKKYQYFTAEDIRDLNIEIWGEDLQGHLYPPMNEFRIQTVDFLATDPTPFV